MEHGYSLKALGLCSSYDPKLVATSYHIQTMVAVLIH